MATAPKRAKPTHVFRTPRLHLVCLCVPPRAGLPPEWRQESGYAGAQVEAVLPNLDRDDDDDDDHHHHHAEVEVAPPRAWHVRKDKESPPPQIGAPVARAVRTSPD